MKYKNLRHTEIDRKLIAVFLSMRHQLYIINKNVHTNVRGSARLYHDETFVVKEFAVLRERHVLSHYIFGSPYPWVLLSKSERFCASWLITKHHILQWENGMIPYSRNSWLQWLWLVQKTTRMTIISYMLKDTRSEDGYKICSRTMQEKMSTSKILTHITKIWNL